ncbi:MAG: DUF721 domain-containing protein [Thermodesulfobacteriota bacterium]
MPGPRHKKPSNIGSVLDRTFRHLGLNAKLREYRVKLAWPEAVGRTVSGKTAPIRLMGKVLHVAVASSPWMTELGYHKKDILSKLNRIVGEAAVTEIVFKPGTVKPLREKTSPQRRPPLRPRHEITEKERSFIDRTAEAIEDPALKELIKRTMEKKYS